MLEYKVKNKLETPPLSRVRVGGFYGEEMRTFFEGRITSAHAREEVYRECEDAFKFQRDDESGVGIWQGEYWGKWIIGACRYAKYSGNEEIREFVKNGARSLMKYRRRDGYLGTYKNSKNVFPCTPEEGMAFIGSPVEWNWNIWCRKYTLWGMLEAFDLIGDPDMLSSAVGMADCLIRELSELSVLPNDTGTFNGLPSCSIMKPMLILYRHTGEKKYLDFCLSIADRWEEPEICPALIANSLSDKRIREWYPDSNKWAKAYEMMSCFDGLIELYRVTGEKKYFDATSRFFDMLLTHERNLLSSVAFNDVFGDAAYDLNCMSEPCDVIHFMRLAYELFLLTADPKYMDVFEETAYNALFASACKDGLWGARALRTAGRHQYALNQAKMKHSHCCVNNMPRGFLNFAESAIATDGTSLFVNLYTDFCGTITVGERSVTVKVGGDYLGEGRAELLISGEGERLPVKLRLPKRCAYYCLTSDARDLRREGDYLLFTAERLPFALTLELDSAAVVSTVESHPTLGDLPWKERRWISGVGADASDTAAYISASPELYRREKRLLIRKGPLILALSKLNGNTECEMFGKGQLTEEHRLISCERIPSPEGINLSFRLTFKCGDDTVEFNACDYASAANIMSLDNRLFTMLFPLAPRGQGKNE